MSLFIAELAYGTSPALSLAKVGILAASVVAAIGGLVALSLAARPASRSAAAEEAPPVG
jgi:Na+/H+ antiporter NhaA